MIVYEHTEKKCCYFQLGNIIVHIHDSKRNFLYKIAINHKGGRETREAICSLIELNLRIVEAR